MLALLFVLGLLGYAIVYTGLAALGSGTGPGILESLNPSFTGADLRGARGGVGASSPAPGGPGSFGELTPALRAALPAMRAFVTARYPGRRFEIISTFRPGAIVAGTSSPSEHGFGNAADVRVLTSSGSMDRAAMDGLYRFLRASGSACELCWNRQGGCTTSHTDHLHYAPRPCRAG